MVFWGGGKKRHLRLGEIDERALLLGQVLRGPLLVFALVLEDLDLVLAAEVVPAAAAAYVRHRCVRACVGDEKQNKTKKTKERLALHVKTRVVTRGTLCIIFFGDDKNTITKH